MTPLFQRSKMSSATTSASLCETAKLNGIDPRAYLIAATKAAIRKPGAVTMPKALPKTAVR